MTSIWDHISDVGSKWDGIVHCVSKNHPALSLSIIFAKY